MDDPILIAKLASKIQIHRDDQGNLLCHNDEYIAGSVGIGAPIKPPFTHGLEELRAYFHQRLAWTIKAEAALRVMLANEILNAAHK